LRLSVEPMSNAADPPQNPADAYEAPA
jgi:hypothetical protein